MEKNFYLFFLIVLISFQCSKEDKPSLKEGKGAISVSTDFQPVDDKLGNDYTKDSILVEIRSNLYQTSKFANSDGSVSFKNLISGKYQIGFSKELSNGLMIGGGGIVEVRSYQTVDTMWRLFPLDPGLKINEVYASWAQNDILYYHDQYIELYNSTNDTIYLDGMTVVRGGSGEKSCSDTDNDDEIENFIKVWRFPGKPVGENQKGNFPCFPKTFVILATDAKNHKDYVSNSVDLSKADFEFVNKRDIADFDNPFVPNIECLNDDFSKDFMYGGTMDIILICTGEDAVEGENPKYPNGFKDGIAIETIIDGVEYQSKTTSHISLDDRIDIGITGIGIGTYSGKSFQRIKPGFDTNNSSIDFEILDHPTPGYQ